MTEHSLDAVRPLLEKARTVAILGASSHRHRAGYYVPAYLATQGYRILSVNPTHLGATLHGEPVRATLAELVEPVDLVDVFRRPDQLAGHVDDILAMRPLPGVVWFQLGIRNDAVAERLRGAGITVVQDRCTLADHKRLF